jgi:transcriptional regulator of heat shock response
MEHMPNVFIEGERDFDEQKRAHTLDNSLYSLVSQLTKNTKEITFAALSGGGATYYLGLSSFLEKNSHTLGEETYRVIKVLENRYQFLDLLNDLDISSRVSVFLGEENILPDLESCAMIVKKITIE